MRTSLFSLLLVSASLFPALAGCGDDDGMNAPDLGPPDLGEQDMDLPMSKKYGPCERDSQCPGVGARCRQPSEGWPNGYCTLPCVEPDEEPCLDDELFYHNCLPDGTGAAWCERRCLNGIDCGRNGYTCVGQFPPAGAGMCIGVCLSDDDCSRGEVCSAESGRCVTSLPTTGGGIGAPCAANADCRSNECITEINAGGYPSGFPGGYCVTRCILPAGYNGNTYFSGPALPQGGCVGGAICIPSRSFAEGDPGICVDECDVPSDCPLSDCVKDFPLASGDTATFTNGVCLPIDCAVDECPAGTTCRTFTPTGGRRTSSCVTM